VTNAQGWAGWFPVFATQAGTYEACVTDVEKAGFLYDPLQNEETCDTVQIP
jgi:hypothetical protein